MANDRPKGDAKRPPHEGDAGKRRQDEDRDRAKRDKQPKNGDIDEGLEDTFPASDPPAPSRPTGVK